ncbi:uncharacterized protein LOC135834700 isoform X2 [Planococcus citri]|uniref:uncharacterized protein LOC135834700 isoform X2 n=1 Tax=Planococcus citri TaxID=170843 RepID=UPI0031F89CFB
MCHVRNFCHIWSLKTGCMTVLSFCLAYEIACILLVFIGKWYDIRVLIWIEVELTAILLCFFGIYEKEKAFFRPYLIIQIFDFIINLAVIVQVIYAGKISLYSVKHIYLPATFHSVDQYVYLSLLTCKAGLMWYGFLVVYNYYKELAPDVNSNQYRTLLNI